MSLSLNQRLLMSDVDYFTTSAAINPFMSSDTEVDMAKAKSEHDSIKNAFLQAGVEVINVPAPKDCQDGVYTANWALIHDNKAVMSNLPNARQAEEAYAHEVIADYVTEIIKPPSDLRFSGQGDALICGKYIFMGSVYRTDLEAHDFVAQNLGLTAISLQTIPDVYPDGNQKINEYSGWPDSYFYDIDLALAIIKNPTHSQPGLIAWCPEALTDESRAKIQSFDDIDMIEVSLKEAKQAFACNLVSTGETVIMSAYAPQLKSELEKRGLKILTPDITELAKGGGYIRCTSLAI